MVWCLDTLKVIGKGQVERSSLCSCEFDMASEEEEFLVINKASRKVINTITFKESAVEKELFGKRDTVHFIKVTDGLLDHLRPEDFKLISDKYFEMTNQKLSILQSYK
ncbi:hypothetical protein M3193_14625 [Sporosarcina luteola]|uniref:hypothetical protein n=1 Tax=Sporosarcina luteola TaxID=582850 RepID=UPI00203D5664|nr:hypothetical protein [Sporosarcina luteola]MCM3745359.1 hypothetical protein [Sporosarcina luteola]